MRLLFQLAVTAVLFALIFWQIGPNSVLDRLQDLRALPLVLAGAVLAGQFAIIAWRWKRIVDHVSPVSASYWDLCRYLGASNLYGQLLPSTVGGDVVRTAMLARSIGIGPATLSVLVDRLTGIIILVLLTMILLPALVWRIGQGSAMVSLVAIAVTAVAALAGLLLLHGRWSLSWFPWAGARIDALISRIREALFDRALAPPLIVCGVLIHLASITLVFVLGRAVGVPLGFLDCLLLVPPALLLTALPVSLAGWGVREGALAGGFALVGVPPSEIVAVSILYGLTGPLLGLIYGAIAALEATLRHGAARDSER